MNKVLYTITKNNIFDLLERLSESNRIFVPYVKRERFYFDEFDPQKEDNIELGGIRQDQPVKSFFAHPRETIVDGSERDRRPVVIAGVKGCDLQSLTLQDFVFQQGDFKDPFYIENRQKTFIISCDCTYAKETCFCLAMEGAPYPQKYFDLNLSPTKDYFLVEIGSDRGAKLVKDYSMFFKEHVPKDIEARRANRESVSVQIKNFIDKRQTPNTVSVKGAVRANYNNTQLWQDFASTCVECGACNLACPTCHCFLLFDEKCDNAARRTRIWDSCLYNTFARVAGGANPRRHLFERLRNRFDKKFEYFPQILNYFACTGCGRCIDACPGDIDIREVLKGVVSGKWNKPPHE